MLGSGMVRQAGTCWVAGKAIAFTGMVSVMLKYQIQIICDGCGRTVRLDPQTGFSLKGAVEWLKLNGWLRGRGGRVHQCPECKQRSGVVESK